MAGDDDHLGNSDRAQPLQRLRHNGPLAQAQEPLGVREGAQASSLSSSQDAGHHWRGLRREWGDSTLSASLADEVAGGPVAHGIRAQVTVVVLEQLAGAGG